MYCLPLNKNSRWLVFYYPRLMLLQEKEQLLRELKGINPKGRSAGEMKEIQQRISQLEYDLNVAVEISNKQIADRCVLVLHPKKKKFPHLKYTAGAHSMQSLASKHT